MNEIAIIGAGPYGLSIAAHLRAAGLDFRIFGSPMQTWIEHMPRGARKMSPTLISGFRSLSKLSASMDSSFNEDLYRSSKIKS
jgi:cation diffusion facilitator CzcD-associated flavoprotein CzcO